MTDKENKKGKDLGILEVQREISETAEAIKKKDEMGDGAMPNFSKIRQFQGAFESIKSEYQKAKSEYGKGGKELFNGIKGQKPDESLGSVFKRQAKEIGAGSKNGQSRRPIYQGNVNDSIGNKELSNNIAFERDKKIKNVDKLRRAEAVNRVSSLRRNGKVLANNIRAKLSRKGNRSLWDAMAITIIIFIFVISITADLLDWVFDAVLVGFFIAPITSLIAGFIIGFLWWSLGVDSNNNRLKNGGKRLRRSCVVEATPLNFFPTFTIMSCINLFDYLGYFDGKSLASVVKNRVSVTTNNVSAV